MYKKKIGNGMQIIALLLFTIMALACASQSKLASGVKDIKSTEPRNENTYSTKEGATIEIPVDSLTPDFVTF